MAWMRIEEASSPQEKQKVRILSVMIYGLIATAATLLAAMEFVEGKGWVAARHLAMGILFSLLAYKGPKLWSGSVGVKLAAVGLVLTYFVLYTVQVIIPLIRSAP